MSDSLYKANRIVIKSEGKKVIDTNSQVSERLKMLSEILENQNVYSDDDDFADGFVEGLDASQVEMLMADNPDGYPDGVFTDGMPSPQGNRRALQEMADEQIQQLLDDARAQADEIINSAKNEADSIIASANTDSEALRNNASKEGYDKGYNDGYHAGEQKASELEAKLNARADAMNAEYEATLDSLEPEFVSNLTDIYSYVLGTDLTGNVQVITHLLKNAIRNIDGTESYFIHVSPEDYEKVLAAREELSSGLGSRTDVEIIEDISLKTSECFIEADSGIFDCSLGTELELLKKELVLLSYQKES